MRHTERVQKPGSPRQRLAAFCLALTLTAAAALNTAFILVRASHRHDRALRGGGCAACLRVAQADSLLKLAGSGAAAPPEDPLFLFAPSDNSPGVPPAAAHGTPVSLKIRQNR